jgi:hypothetical protein
VRARLDYEDDDLQRRYFIDLNEMHIAQSGCRRGSDEFVVGAQIDAR